MPCPHFRIKISTRSNSPPTTAQAAYQSGERLYDERTHRTKNYDDKRGVIFTEIQLPENAPEEYLDRNKLWNSVEWSETNWNAQIARKFHIALPRELPMEHNIEMIRQFVHEQFVSRGMIVDLAVHDPDPPNHNPHVHLMIPMRAVDENGKWLPKCHREYVLDENGDRIKDEKDKWKFRKVFTTDWDDRSNAETWRQAWEDIQNRYLEAAERPERISMKSYERQGIDQIPTVHMGPAVTAMERRGIETNIGNLNREIKKTNALITAIKRAITKIKEWLSDLKEGIKEIEMEPKEILLVDLLIQRFNERKEERRETWNSAYSQNRGTVKDLQRFADITAYMREKNIRSVADLDSRLEEISAAGQPTRDQMKTVRSRITKVERLLEAGERKAKLDPVHDQYLKIHWKGRKEKFAMEHKAELDAWNQAERTIRKDLPDQPFNAGALQTELSSLNAQLEDLNIQLQPLRDETEMLKEIRYLVKDLIPELEPEREKMTPESKSWREMTVRERLAAAQKEVDAERQRQQPPQRKHRDRER